MTKYNTDIAITQAVACSTDLTNPENMAMRVEMLIDAALNESRLPLTIDENMGYQYQPLNPVNPAVDTLHRVYAGLHAGDRVEVVVYDENNHVKQIMVDTPIFGDNRRITLTSKIQEAQLRMCNELNQLTQMIHVPPLNSMELEMAEIIYDDRLLRATFENV